MEHEHSILYKPFNALWHAIAPWPWDVPDHVIMALLVLVISCVLFPLVRSRISRDNPGTLQQFCELVVSGLKGMLNDIIGHGGEKHLYIIGAFAVFIFISNIFGLFFFLQPPTSNVNTTFAMSITAFLYYNWQGIKAQGLLHYLGHFGGPVWWLSPLMFLIEMIGNFARIVSLAMRLFGNIFGEHAAAGVFMGMLPFVLPWPMMGLGIFGAFLQTFVFILLNMVYISGATATEEH
ncbi:MAG TPA: F0F1 ATP synthase subunit A [Thermoanaerobaculia bacterium]|nr:F0F1 ATP synthase subunit A [Thermoanaerobaculia bacterium]